MNGQAGRSEMRSSGHGARRGARGMTLIELITVVTTMAITSAIALPNLMGSIERSNTSSATRQLVSDIHTAQSTARTRGVQVRLLSFDSTGTATIVNAGTTTTVTDATRKNMYRLEIKTTPSASWPALSDTPASNANVLTAWQDVPRPVRIAASNALIFNTMGGLTNSTTPLSIVIEGAASSHTVQTSPLGKTTVL